MDRQTDEGSSARMRQRCERAQVEVGRLFQAYPEVLTAFQESTVGSASSASPASKLDRVALPSRLIDLNDRELVGACNRAHHAVFARRRQWTVELDVVEDILFKLLPLAYESDEVERLSQLDQTKRRKDDGVRPIALTRDYLDFAIEVLMAGLDERSANLRFVKTGLGGSVTGAGLRVPEDVCDSEDRGGPLPPESGIDDRRFDYQIVLHFSMEIGFATQEQVYAAFVGRADWDEFKSRFFDEFDWRVDPSNPERFTPYICYRKDPENSPVWEERFRRLGSLFKIIRVLEVPPRDRDRNDSLMRPIRDILSRCARRTTEREAGG